MLQGGSDRDQKEGADLRRIEEERSKELEVLDDGLNLWGGMRKRKKNLPRKAAGFFLECCG